MITQESINKLVVILNILKDYKYICHCGYTIKVNGFKAEDKLIILNGVVMGNNRIDFDDSYCIKYDDDHKIIGISEDDFFYKLSIIFKNH